jgi:curved DNA-binding protein CbpA
LKHHPDKNKNNPNAAEKFKGKGKGQRLADAPDAKGLALNMMLMP